MKAKIENFADDTDTIKVSVGSVTVTVWRDEMGQVAVVLDEPGSSERVEYLGDRAYFDD
jgi:hypothetical protein